MGIVRGGGDTARGAVRETETTATGIETARGHATGGEMVTETATGVGTVHVAARTDIATTASSLGERGSQTTNDNDQGRILETTAGAATRGANRLTRLRGGETRRRKRQGMKLLTNLSHANGKLRFYHSYSVPSESSVLLLV